MGLIIKLYLPVKKLIAFKRNRLAKFIVFDDRKEIFMVGTVFGKSQIAYVRAAIIVLCKISRRKSSDGSCCLVSESEVHQSVLPG